jgi:hypothetical protein
MRRNKFFFRSSRPLAPSLPFPHFWEEQGKPGLVVSGLLCTDLPSQCVLRVVGTPGSPKKVIRPYSAQ